MTSEEVEEIKVVLLDVKFLSWTINDICPFHKARNLTKEY